MEAKETSSSSVKKTLKCKISPHSNKPIEINFTVGFPMEDTRQQLVPPKKKNHTPSAHFVCVSN